MRFLIYILVVFVLAGCSKKINQYRTYSPTVQKRHGKWVENTQTDDGEYLEKGKYNNGNRIGKWKTYFTAKNFDKKLYQKDVYRDSIITTTIYHPNGKIMEKGQSKTEKKDNYGRWYYFGDWKTFDNKGNLIFIRHFVDGKEMDTTFIKK